MPIKQCAPPKKEGYAIVAVIVVGFLLIYSSQSIATAVTDNTNQMEWKCSLFGPLIYSLNGRDTATLKQECISSQIEADVQAAAAMSLENVNKNANQQGIAQADGEKQRKIIGNTNKSMFSNFNSMGKIFATIMSTVQDSFTHVQTVMEKGTAQANLLTKMAEVQLRMANLNTLKN